MSNISITSCHAAGKAVLDLNGKWKDNRVMTKPLYVRGTALGSGMPKICVPVTGETKDDILTQVKSAADAGAELIEWRMDFWKEESPKKYLEETLYAVSGAAPDIPLIFTIRTDREGGNFRYSARDYIALNETAAESGRADLIDIEYLQDPEEMGALIEKLQGLGVKVIASNHDFEKTAENDELLEKFSRLGESGADVLKMAVMPHDTSDTERLMACTRQTVDEVTDKPVIAMAMGKDGTVSRIEGENFGSCVTFGTIGNASAPGQLPIGELRELLEELHRKK